MDASNLKLSQRGVSSDIVPECNYIGMIGLLLNTVSNVRPNPVKLDYSVRT